MEQLELILTFTKDHTALALAGVIGIVFFVARKLAGRITDDVYKYLKQKLIGKSGDKTPASASSAPAPAVAVGDVQTGRGSYRMGAALARGALAQVYEAETIAGPRDTPRVVFKVALDGLDNDMLYNEVRILKILNGDQSRYQKHLPLLVDQFKTGDNRRANILSRLDGYDLHSIREKYTEGIPVRHIIWIFRRCLSVLGYAHSVGVIHANVDPSHIIVRPEDHNVWLVDWCYAVHKPARTGEGFKVLNETYSPPEVEQRKPPLPAADLYSLGKCMVYLLGGNVDTGEMPEGVDERIARFIQFFLIESAPSRAQDAWEMYGKLDKLREEVYGKHEFVEFKM